MYSSGSFHGTASHVYPYIADGSGVFSILITPPVFSGSCPVISISSAPIRSAFSSLCPSIQKLAMFISSPHMNVMVHLGRSIFPSSISFLYAVAMPSSDPTPVALSPQPGSCTCAQMRILFSGWTDPFTSAIATAWPLPGFPSVFVIGYTWPIAIWRPVTFTLSASDAAFLLISFALARSAFRLSNCLLLNCHSITGSPASISSTVSSSPHPSAYLDESYHGSRIFPFSSFGQRKLSTDFLDAAPIAPTQDA